ncbi:hypothetical protein ACRAWF_36565 [Streptomyces sp. L7]
MRLAGRGGAAVLRRSAPVSGGGAAAPGDLGARRDRLVLGGGPVRRGGQLRVVAAARASWWVLGGVVLPALVLRAAPAEYRARRACPATGGGPRRVGGRHGPSPRRRPAGSPRPLPHPRRNVPSRPWGRTDRPGIPRPPCRGPAGRRDDRHPRDRARPHRPAVRRAGQAAGPRAAAGSGPVLRVLVRETAHGDTEVLAADDSAALRPLFRVSVSDPDNTAAGIHPADRTHRDPEDADDLDALPSALDVVVDDVLNDVLGGGGGLPAERSGPPPRGRPLRHPLRRRRDPPRQRPLEAGWGAANAVVVRARAAVVGARGAAAARAGEAGGGRAARSDARHAELVAAVTARNAEPVPVRRGEPARWTGWRPS